MLKLLRFMGLLGALACACAPAWATLSPTDQARVKGLAWLYQHQNGDGSWNNAAGLAVQSTAAALGALRNAGVSAGPGYSNGLAWLENAQAGSVDSLSRQIQALAAAKLNVAAYAANLVNGRNPYKGWGAYAGYDSSLPDTTLAVSSLLGAQAYSSNDALAGLCVVLPHQLADHSWPYTLVGLKAPAGQPANQQTGAILPTVSAILLINQVTKQFGYTSVTCNGTAYTFSTVTNNALAWLLTKQNADGGFGDYGVSTVQGTALAYQVLNLLQPSATATTAALNYLLAQQNPSDGSWNEDPFQTGLVLSAFPATALAQTDQDGIPDAVETALGTSTTAPDSKSVLAAKSNGQSLSGVTTPGFKTIASHDQPFQMALAGQGTAPYGNFHLLSGALPPGLSLDAATGQVSGSPGALGTYNLTYRYKDGTGAVATQVGQITVAASASDTDVPVLPPWGAALMAALLLATLVAGKQRRQG